jgi:hypothetical protein
MLLFILLLISCEKPKPNFKRTIEQTRALNNDTLLLDFSLFMDTLNYKANFLKAIINKKIVKMDDGSFKYELDLGEKLSYGSINTLFLNDSLVSIKITFGENITNELREILEKKYGQPNTIEASRVSWESENFRKSIELNTLDNYVEYRNTIKYVEKMILIFDKANAKKDSAIRKTQKDF